MKKINKVWSVNEARRRKWLAPRKHAELNLKIDQYEHINSIQAEVIGELKEWRDAVLDSISRLMGRGTEDAGGRVTSLAEFTGILGSYVTDKYPRDMRSWIPVSSAPTDGTTILGLSKNEVQPIVIVHWDPSVQEWSTRFPMPNIFRTITHWLPLPEVPKL